MSAMTLEQAIDALVEMDVAKWGEGERAASRSLHARNLRTLGAALNTLANRDSSYRTLADAAMTRKDVGALRRAARDR